MKSPGFKHWKYHPPPQEKREEERLTSTALQMEESCAQVLRWRLRAGRAAWLNGVTAQRLQSTLTFVSSSLLILKFSVPGPALMAVTTESHVS